MKNQIGVDKSLVTLANAMFFHLSIRNTTMKSLSVVKFEKTVLRKSKQ